MKYELFDNEKSIKIICEKNDDFEKVKELVVQFVLDSNEGLVC